MCLLSRTVDDLSAANSSWTSQKVIMAEKENTREIVSFEIVLVRSLIILL
jgi:hypothetical protein